MERKDSRHAPFVKRVRSKTQWKKRRRRWENAVDA